MRFRCSSPKATGYHRYGGRGIKVCDRWNNSFAAFYSDMGDPPSVRHTLDRYPNKDGNYEPGNCRWATQTQQARNMSRNRIVSVNGQKMTLVEAVQSKGLKYNTVLYRILRGKTPEEALV